MRAKELKGFVLKEDPEVPSDDPRAERINNFAQWAGKILKVKNLPVVKLSLDTEEAQGNHHTGGYMPGSDHIWCYAKNRNLVDMMRTVFHELVHVRQHELDMIKPGDSYPGSPIEVMADVLAGKYIKIYGEANPTIFEDSVADDWKNFLSEKRK